MIACTLSNLELRSIIESAFLPMRCNCSVVDDCMSVEIIDPVSQDVKLYSSGISLDHLDTSRALCELITALRSELNKQPQPFPHALAG